MNPKMYDLTNQQKNILSIEKYYNNTSLNTNCGNAQIKEKINFDLLSQAITLLVKNNSIFSLTFKETNDNLKQFIGDPISYSPEIVNIKNEKELKKLEQTLSHKILFSAERLFEFVIYRFPNDHGGVIGIAHHILSDSWGVGLMFDEILRIYSELVSNTYKNVPSEYSYINYVQKEQEYLASSSYEKDKVFWEEIYKTVPEVVSIPSVNTNSKAVISCLADRKAFSISETTMSSINQFCKDNKISVYNFFMAIYSIYIGNITNNDDFVIGTPILNRLNLADKHTIGMFVSTVPFRVNLSDNVTFSDFSKAIAQNTLSILRHQRYPYQEILKSLRKSDSSIPNLYNIVLSYQITKLANAGLNCESSWIFNGTSADDVQIHIVDYDNKGSLDILYDYKTDKYISSDIVNMHKRILTIISQVLDNSSISISDIEIITPEEKNELIFDLNNYQLKYEKDKTISQLFEEQVEKTPNATALVFENQKLTYKELNDYANSLAFKLRNQGISTNDIVGIMVSRSFEMIVSILAVLKSGACYIPIDPTYPADRINYMLENSNSKVLLTLKSLKNKVNYNKKMFIDLSSDFYLKNKKNLKNINNPNDLAYIIYTSGSTGKPKGVMITHKSISNLTAYCNKYVKYLKERRHRTIASITTMSFDIFVFETLISLQRGLKIVIANEDEQTIPRLLNNLIKNNKVEIIQSTPSRMQLLLYNLEDIPAISNLKFITLAGEQLPLSLVNDLKKICSPIVYNGYGPSETTIFSTLTDVTDSNPITIGKPVPNTQIFILNNKRNLLPKGIPGEIYIAGDGVGLGYINNGSLTNASYLTCPFYAESFMYKSGDLGFYNSEGNIICLGRIDNQVKIRGLRIELSEIESVILNNKKINNCIVLKQTLADNHEVLCAYYTSDKEVDISALRSSLQGTLPIYMVPQYFIKLEKFNYTPNGKIDRKNLPLPKDIQLTREKIMPRNNVDKELISIFNDLLGTNISNINSSFFELGGDSLTAINLCTRIYNKYKVQLFMKDIISDPTVSHISDLINDKLGESKNVEIEKADFSEYYPASYAQSRMYLSSTISGTDSTLYNITGGLILNKLPTVKKLEAAFKQLIILQPSLRTSFEVKDGNVVQKVHDTVSFKLEHPLSIIDNSDIDKEFKKFNRPFDLSNAPLIRARLVKLKNKQVLLMISTHHIVSDGKSLEILLNNLSALYNNKQVKPLDIDYKDYTIWERKNMSFGNMKKDEAFWLSQFKEDIPVLNIPSKPRPINQTFEGDVVCSKIDSSTNQKINALSKQLGITPNMLLLSVYYTLLYKYTMQNDIVVGTPILNRESISLQDIIGMFVNTLPIRLRFSDSITFAELISSVKTACLNAYTHQQYPIDQLVNKLDLNRDPSRGPLFDTAFVFQNNGLPSVSFNRIKSIPYVPKSTVSKFDLSLEIISQDNELKLNFEYAVKLFDKTFIKNFSNHYINILNTILSDVNIAVNKIDMLSASEKETIIYGFNNTNSDYPKDLSVSKLFEAQVEQTPDNVALVFKKKALAYYELNEKANSFAHCLHELGIKKGDILPVLLPRSIDLVVCILALNKLGACYLPLSTDYPLDRINYIIDNSKSNYIITDTNFIKKFDRKINIINISKINLDNYSKENLNTNIAPDDLLYIIYTSGSTGNPKGVMVTNKNLNNFIHCFTKMYNGISTKDRMLASTNICFDVSIFEFYISLLNGAQLHLYEDNTISDIFDYCNSIIQNKITMLYIPPNILEEVYSVLRKHNYKQLNKLLIGVEAIKSETIKKYYNLNNSINIINGYGPTEATICATAFKVEEADLDTYNIVPIGKPLDNLTLYVLDKDLNPVPKNVPGELYICGDNLSKGYLNNTSLNNKFFINIDQKRFYKTGDIVVLDNNNNLNFIGRNDSQIKINGHRIELGEIEKTIYQYPDILKVVVLLNEKNKLCAFFTAKKKVSLDAIKLFLQTKLPQYFIPNFIIQLDDFKLTPNGKVDRKELLKISLENQTTYVAPKTRLQKDLVSIFEKILNVEKIGIYDNIFDLGADSLATIKLSLQIQNDLGYTVNSKDIFENYTIANLSNFINNTLNKQSSSKIKRAKAKDSYPLSSAQLGIYYATKMAGEASILYNVPYGIIFEKKPNIKRLETCLYQLTQRHESLRTYFEIEDNSLVQKIADTVDFKIEIQKELIHPEDLKAEFDKFVKPFNLSEAPLFRAKLLSFTDGKVALITDMHHIISDGASSYIICDELCKLYNGESLSPLDITYKDFVEWEISKNELKEPSDAEKYWEKQLSGELPVLNLPLSYSRPAIKTFDGNKINISIGSVLTQRLIDVCNLLNVTPYMFLLSVYYVLLSKYSGQDDIIVGSPTVGRNSSILNNIVGMFVNTLPIRAKVSDNIKFKTFVNNIKDICLENFKYQDYPLDMLIKKLNISRDTSRNPLFDVIFTYQNEGFPSINFDKIKSEYYIPDNKISKFDLSLEVVPKGDELFFSFEYATKLFNKPFIENLSNHYFNVLNIVLNNLDIKLSDICVLSNDEKNKLLYDFNSTKSEYPKEKTISQLFEEQASKTPERTALVFHNKKMTYKELSNKVNSLAVYLQQNGLNRHDVVGIMTNRSFEMIIAILAVLKSGGTYVPIDPEYPQDRIKYMLKNSNAKMLLTKTDVESTLSFENKHFIDLNIKEIYNNYNKPDTINCDPEDLAYIIYTSGSTGTPKGVMLKNSNIVNFIYAIKQLNLDKYNTIISITTISFDIFVLESLFPLLSGLKVVIAPEEAQTDAKIFSDLCVKNKVDMIQTTPSRMQAFLYNQSNIAFLTTAKCLLIGGEPFPPSLLKELRDKFNGEILNMYGPTETAVWSSYKDLSKTDDINIGTPLANTQMYILDKYKNPLPVDVPGELYISGDGVCAGYLNNPDLTNTVFTKNSFVENTLMYKTGDFCKRLPSGEIEYLERLDNQVKVRGLRIELGEIESKILNYPEINKVCVIKQTVNNRDFLSAYFTASKRINVSNLRKHLHKQLPSYMVPTYFSALDDFPYTPNGKINKKALPLPKEILSSTNKKEYVAPKTKLEKSMVAIWEKLLNVSPIGITDNFFELGGDSILAMNLNIELKSITNSISYSDIFKYPTIYELVNKSKSHDENYDFKYTNKDYNKYSDLLNKNLKSPRFFELKYSSAKNILLTGATGFLGIHILDSFLKKEKGNIYCLIREEPGLTAQAKLYQKLNYYFGDKYNKYIGKRIFAITADICKPGFGLGQDELLNLANNVNIVINSAAKVAHFGVYSDFYKANVLSVKNIIDFCKSFDKKLYHVSTLSVSGNDLDNKLMNNSNTKINYNESNLYVGQSLENVYIRSKFEAETCVLDAQLSGLDAYILRVGNLMPRYKDGAFQENVTENAFVNRIATFLSLEVVPENLLNEYLEFTPIDITANAIIKIITHPTKNNRMFHLYNHNHVSIRNCLLYFVMLNPNLKVVSEDEFSAIIKKCLKSRKKKEFLNSIINDFNNNLQLTYKTDIIISSELTKKYLSKIGFHWPKITDRYLKNFINILRKVIN